MPKRITVPLSEAQQQELVQVRDQHPKPYLRERAAAVLKVASGLTVTAVAEQGLHKRHEPETVRLWIDRYLEQGVAGWTIRPGRGRKPKFSPSGSGHRA
jgi:transposase